MRKLFMIFLLLATAVSAETLTSGLSVGEMAPAHNPRHITGPDAGTDVCPV